LRARFAIITGGPGTGKTTTLTKLLSLLIELAEQEQQRKLTILLAAPTGKAAARVSESIAKALENLPVPEHIKQQIPKQATTLHRLLGSRPDSRGFKHDQHHPLLADIVIVDEASMIDLEMMAALLDALPDSTQLILLGDKDQLASVEAGSVMGDLCQGAEWAAYDADTLDWITNYAQQALPVTQNMGSAINQQTVMLRYSHRFGSESGIGQLARAVNAGEAANAERILSAAQSYPDLQRIGLSSLADSRLKQLISASGGNPGYGDYVKLLQQPPIEPCAYDQWALAVLLAFDRFQVLSALRGGDWGVEGLNQRIEHWLFPDKKPGVWYAGRPVMITRNDYNLGLMNGDIGMTLTDPDHKLRVAFPGEAGNIRWVSPLRLPDVETAFAMTVHKSQGSEFQHVALVLPEVRSPVLTRELIYTGITRAREYFSLLETRPTVLAQAIENRRK
jgi:exodeoxyribonuclease V alpha subunit